MYASFIEQWFQHSSKIALKSFGRVSSSVKSEDDNQVLTEADLEIGKFIVDKIKEEFPNHNIVDEEAGIVDKKSKYTWVIDPIDGTSNFANGIPTYGIMVGLIIEDRPYAGGISLPYFSEIYLAVKGKGAYCNGKRIFVSSEKTLLNSLIAYGIDGHQENPELTLEECRFLSKMILRIRNLRTSNSCFDAAMVARGKYGAFLNKTSKIWDNVSQQVIIEEAGGKYTDFYGKPIDCSNVLSKAKDNFTWCAGAPMIHKELIELINNDYP